MTCKLSRSTSLLAVIIASHDGSSLETSKSLLSLVDRYTQMDECEELEHLKCTIEDVLMTITPLPFLRKHSQMESISVFSLGYRILSIESSVITML